MWPSASRAGDLGNDAPRRRRAQLDQGRSPALSPMRRARCFPARHGHRDLSRAHRHANRGLRRERHVSLPGAASGTYALTFELTGFRTVKRENIQLDRSDADRRSRARGLDVEETVLVTSESPVVDLQSTKVGVQFSAEKLAAIPSATDLWAALGQAPGVRMLGFDVGGSLTSRSATRASACADRTAS